MVTLRLTGCYFTESHPLFIYSFIYSAPQTLPSRFGCRFQAGSPPLPEMKALKDRIHISDIQRELLWMDRIIEASVQNYTVHCDNTPTTAKMP